MQRYSVPFLILLCGIALQGCETAAVRAYSDDIAIKECWFEADDDWPETECGVLTVPEDYSKPLGRQVELPFVIVRAAEYDESTRPLVVAGGGGPGGALGITGTDWDAVDEALWVDWYYSTIDAGRDLILIDNRGVGSSLPRLDCEEVTSEDLALLSKELDQGEWMKRTKESLSACRQALVDQGIDIGQYHVINAARDLEQLRTGLGLDQFNVYGVSYGTRVSLVYERLYPESVRTLILDGIYPQSVRTYEDDPEHSYEAIARVIGKCRQDDQCYRRFGKNLNVRLSEYLEKLDASPVTITVTSPIDYKPIEVIVTPDVFFDSIFSALYSETMIAFLPKYLYAIFEGNADYLTELVRDYYVNGIVDDLDIGAYASYTCFDDIPFADMAAAREQLNAYPFQHFSSERTFDYAELMCEVWDVPAAPADFKAGYRIDTPVLIYSGELDPITPAELAKPVMDNARTSWEKVWPGISHGVMVSSTCADYTAEAFLKNPESDPFIYECAGEKSDFEFILR